MKWLSRAVDKLPPWAKLTLAVLTVIGSIYCISQYGFFGFLLRVIFSP